MANITMVHELYPEGTVELGAVQEVSMRFRASFDDGTERWFYYGVEPPPELTDAVARPAVRFPADFYNVPEASDLTFDLAYEVARYLAESD